MKRQGLILLFSLMMLPIGASGVQEDKIYIVPEKEEAIDADLPRPDFLKENAYDYEKESGDDGVWHIFSISKKNGFKVADKEEIYNDLENVFPRETTYAQIINRYGLPPQVVIATSGINSGRKFYHLNFVYDELSFYFGVDFEKLQEIRIESSSDFQYKGLSFNSTLEEIIELYPPAEIIEGREINWESSAVLFKNADGREGFNYIDYKELNLRLFLNGDRISAFYIY